MFNVPQVGPDRSKNLQHNLPRNLRLRTIIIVLWTNTLQRTRPQIRHLT